MAEWHFLSNTGLVLVCVARNPGMTLREIGDCVGVTERTAHGLVRELVAFGCLASSRVGTRNHYQVNREAPMRHSMFNGQQVGDLLDVLAGTNGSSDSSDIGADAGQRARQPGQI